jgi:hypothetical protein
MAPRGAPSIARPSSSYSSPSAWPTSAYDSWDELASVRPIFHRCESGRRAQTTDLDPEGRAIRIDEAESAEPAKRGVGRTRRSSRLSLLADDDAWTRRESALRMITFWYGSAIRLATSGLWVRRFGDQRLCELRIMRVPRVRLLANRELLRVLDVAELVERGE